MTYGAKALYVMQGFTNPSGPVRQAIFYLRERGVVQSESLRREGRTSLQLYKAEAASIYMPEGAAQAAGR